MGHETTLDAAHLPASVGYRVSRMTMWRVAFVLMCFAPQVRNLQPQVGLATLLVGAMLAYVSLVPYRWSRSSIFFAGYFIVFGMLGLLVQLFGYVPLDNPPARPLFLYSLTTLAMVLTGLAIVRQGGSQFVLRVLCTLLVVEIAIVALQFAFLSFGVGLEPGEDAMRDNLIEGSYGNPNNVAMVLSMVLMVLVMSGYVRMSSLFGAALVIATLLATFVTLSRTALVSLVLFLAAAMLTPKLQRLNAAALMRALRGLLLGLALLGAALLVLLRSDVMTNLEDLAVVERSVSRVAELQGFGQEASVAWRVVVMSRLIESLDSLGLGSLSDQNYGEFFQPLDPLLATINPHSYLVEMSFLFGYLGLCMALGFLAVAIWRVVTVTGSRRFLAVLFGISVLFLQMVPSSVLELDIFFLLIVLAGTRGLHGAPVRPR